MVFLATAFFVAVFFVARFLTAVFFVARFLTAVFFVVVLRATFLVATFLRAFFGAARFFVADFFVAALRAVFAEPLSLAFRVRHQRQNQRGRKVYSLHAPEVECIAKGKSHKPYEFGVKVSLATTLNHSAGGQFIAHAKALPGNPYDGHTLEKVIPDIERQIGATIARLVAEKGYHGHNSPSEYRFRIYISGQKRGVTDAIKRDLRRRSAIEPVIGHAKSDHRMDRNYLKGSEGDAINAVLAAAGYNFRRLLAWLRLFLRAWLATIMATNTDHQSVFAA